MNHRSLVVLALLASLLSGRCRAQAATEDFLVPECSVRLERYNNDSPPSLRLRPACRLGVESTRAALAALVSRMSPGATAAARVSIFIGRIEEYPWLSEALATAARDSPKWSARRGRMRADDGMINGFVAALLRDDPLLRAILPGWRLTGVSVEKVLVGPAERYLPASGLRGRLPFDALCWLALSRADEAHPLGESARQGGPPSSDK